MQVTRLYLRDKDDLLEVWLLRGLGKYVVSTTTRIKFDQEEQEAIFSDAGVPVTLEKEGLDDERDGYLQDHKLFKVANKYGIYIPEDMVKELDVLVDGKTERVSLEDFLGQL